MAAAVRPIQVDAAHVTDTDRDVAVRRLRSCARFVVERTLASAARPAQAPAPNEVHTSRSVLVAPRAALGESVHFVAALLEVLRQLRERALGTAARRLPAIDQDPDTERALRLHQSADEYSLGR
jgi:hypothetical protein